MTPEKQLIAIAEACGWTVRRWTDGEGFECVGLLPPGSDKTSSGFRHPPDYLNDLNAMHEAEKALLSCADWRPIRAYFSNLSPNLHSDGALDGDDWKLCHATAAQRAEAFLRTIGKWEESA